MDHFDIESFLKNRRFKLLEEKERLNDLSEKYASRRSTSNQAEPSCCAVKIIETKHQIVHTPKDDVRKPKFAAESVELLPSTGEKLLLTSKTAKDFTNIQRAENNSFHKYSRNSMDISDEFYSFFPSFNRSSSIKNESFIHNVFEKSLERTTGSFKNSSSCYVNTIPSSPESRIRIKPGMFEDSSNSSTPREVRSTSFSKAKLNEDLKHSPIVAFIGESNISSRNQSAVEIAREKDILYRQALKQQIEERRKRIEEENAKRMLEEELFDRKIQKQLELLQIEEDDARQRKRERSPNLSTQSLIDERELQPPVCLTSTPKLSENNEKDIVCEKLVSSTSDLSKTFEIYDRGNESMILSKSPEILHGRSSPVCKNPDESLNDVDIYQMARVTNSKLSKLLRNYGDLETSFRKSSKLRTNSESKN